MLEWREQEPSDTLRVRHKTLKLPTAYYHMAMNNFYLQRVSINLHIHLQQQRNASLHSVKFKRGENNFEFTIANRKYYTFRECDWFKRPCMQFETFR